MISVAGNHDPEPFNSDFEKFMDDSGIVFLNDATYDTNKVCIIGRADYYHNGQVYRKTLKELMNDKMGKYRIIIDHNPIGIMEAIESEADLVLCGHTHKGQISPLGLFTMIVHGRKNLYGHSHRAKTDSIVTSGAGFFGMPFRIGSNNEVVLIKIKGINK